MSTRDRCMSILPVIVVLSDYGSFRVWSAIRKLSSWPSLVIAVDVEDGTALTVTRCPLLPIQTDVLLRISN
jgi:hypothetical protein